ncbi:MAG: Restriction endonuclease [Parcubacteria group bacterium GW2011_GWD2_42_14]|nr:MAG: Restriction endonuclease [Parcubacteria group bacterium GW2011_GWD2_42_14]
MIKILDDILSYREMCDAENTQTMQRGMNYRMNPTYSVFLMSQKPNAPYSDSVHNDGVTIEYEGHDLAKNYTVNPKHEDQPEKLPSGKITQNGLFIKAVDEYKSNKSKPEIVKVYEKIQEGVWSLKGFFNLIDYKIVNDGKRNVFRFILKLSDRIENFNNQNLKLTHTRLIPSQIKKDVWKRDQGRCVLCDESKNLHFDHDLPFSKGGTSLLVNNVRLLCAKCNLKKSDKIE